MLKVSVGQNLINIKEKQTSQKKKKPTSDPGFHCCSTDGVMDILGELGKD